MRNLYAAGIFAIATVACGAPDLTFADDVPPDSGGSTAAAGGSTTGAGGSATGGRGFAVGAGGPFTGGGGGFTGSGGAFTGGGGAFGGGRRVPTGIVTGVSYPTMQLSPSPGGSMYTDTCPQDNVAIGFNGTWNMTTGTFPHSIQLVCGALSVSGTGPFEVTTSPISTTMPVRGNPGPMAQNRMCPANQVVTGLDPRAGMYIDQLTFRCAPLTISGGPDAYTLSIGTMSAIDPIGGAGGMIFPPINCNPGGVAIGSIVRAGIAVDSFGLTCALPSLVLTP